MPPMPIKQEDFVFQAKNLIYPGPTPGTYQKHCTQMVSVSQNGNAYFHKNLATSYDPSKIETKSNFNQNSTISNFNVRKSFDVSDKA
jgi:hypothetical protein